LIAASRREKVQDRQGLAEAAGLKAVILDVESYASRLAASRLIEALPNKGVDSMVALFEVGALTTSMQVIRNDEVLYDRDQAFGGAQLSQLIVRQYGFSVEEAENKKRSGDLPEDYASAVLRPFVESMAQEIGRALQFFFTSTPHNRVDRILLAGGSSPLQGLPEAVTQHTGFPCSIVNPFEGMEIQQCAHQEDGSGGSVLSHVPVLYDAEVHAVILIIYPASRSGAQAPRRIPATMFASFLVGLLIAASSIGGFNDD
jgi:type IV pilus assembly protein PilM